MADIASIANQAITELKRVKTNLRFRSPLYLAIQNETQIEHSNLWFILKDISLAVIILPYSYIVLTAEDSSAFVLFIEENGNCKDYLVRRGWTLKFDTPKESLYRTYQRQASISNGLYEIILSTPAGDLTIEDFKKIWEYFILISNISDDFSSIFLYKELYDKDIEIRHLKGNIIKNEYENYVLKTLHENYKKLLDNLTQLTKLK